MESLDAEAEAVQRKGQSDAGRWEVPFWLVSGVGGVWAAYYLMVVRFPLLVIKPAYAILPNPYLSLAAVVLLAVFIYRYRAFFFRRDLRGWARELTVLLMMSAFALSSATLVRETAYRLPGVRILLNSELYDRIWLRELGRSMQQYCWPDGESYERHCPKDAMKMVNAHMDGLEAKVGGDLIEGDLTRFLFVEVLALATMIAVFLGLHRLVMSGRLGQSRYHYIRIFNRYGAEP